MIKKTEFETLEELQRVYPIGSIFSTSIEKERWYCPSEEDIKAAINITSAWTAHTDDYFFEGEIDDETGLRRANFSPYWKKVGDVWVAMEGNSRDYNKLINKDISIRTNFNPVDLLIDKYII